MTAGQESIILSMNPACPERLLDEWKRLMVCRTTRIPAGKSKEGAIRVSVWAKGAMGLEASCMSSFGYSDILIDLNRHIKYKANAGGFGGRVWLMAVGNKDGEDQ